MSDVKVKRAPAKRASSAAIAKSKRKTKAKKNPISDDAGGGESLYANPADDLAKTRGSAVVLLLNALVAEAHAPGEREPGVVAKELENELYAFYGRRADASYQEKLKSIVFNLGKKRNPALRKALMRGRLASRIFVRLAPNELANAKLADERAADEDWERAVATLASHDESTTTTAYTCSGCGGNNCRTLQLQIRGGDEAMTTFIRCVRCGKSWRN